jgi:hypothetical protein
MGLQSWLGSKTKVECKINVSLDFHALAFTLFSINPQQILSFSHVII